VVAVVWDCELKLASRGKIDAIDRAGRELVKLEADSLKPVECRSSGSSCWKTRSSATRKS